MKYILFCFCLTISVLGTSYAQIAFHGKIINVPPTLAQQAAVEYWNTDRWQQVDVVDLGTDGAFSKTVTVPAGSQCRLRITNKAKMWSEFIVPGLEEKATELVFDLDFRKMNGGPAKVPCSPENVLYEQLTSAYKNLSHLRDSLNNPDAPAFLEAQRGFNQTCVDMSRQHKGSFTGDIAANLYYQPLREDYVKDAKTASMTAQEFAIEHALDKTPFLDARSLRHNGFLKALDKYSNYFDQTTEGLKSYTDRLMGRRNGSEEVDGFLFKFLLERMLSYKDEPALTYLLTWFLPDCTDENPLPSSTQHLLESLKNCQPGKVAFDLQLPAADSQIVSLKTVSAKNKITIILIWRSTCTHCQEFEPILAGIYEKYHPLGVEVYAMSTDNNTSAWKRFLTEHPTKWYNVYIPMERRSEIARQFPSPSTPTLITVDRNMKVLSRLVNRANLESYLDDMLKKTDQ
jgi:thiol-disulfide isomerase/thioredoxin